MTGKMKKEDREFWAALIILNSVGLNAGKREIRMVLDIIKELEAQVYNEV